MHSKVRNQHFECDICFSTFTTKSNLQRHKRKVHRQHNIKKMREWKCRHCYKTFDENVTLLNHVEADHPLIKQTGGRRAFPTTDREIPVGNQRPLEDDILSTSNQIPTSTEHNAPPTSNHNVPDEENEENALNNIVQRKIVYPKGEEKLDMLIFLANCKSEIRNYLIAKLKRSRSIKWNLCIQIEMERDRADTGQNTSPYFRSRTYLTLTNETLSEHDLKKHCKRCMAAWRNFLEMVVDGT